MKNQYFINKLIICSLIACLSMFISACLEIGDNKYDPNSSNFIGYRCVRQIRYDNPGPDFAWFTNDDLIAGYLDWVYENNKRTRFILYIDDGDNETWFDDDDVILFYTDFEYENTLYPSMTSKSISYNSGTNGTWLDSDDDITSYALYEFDSQGKWTQSITYIDGGDLIWFNDDDVATSYTKYMYHSNGNFDKWVHYDTVNLIAFDGDDVITEYWDHPPYDEYPVGYIAFNDAGNDTEWFTEDDEMAWHYKYIYVLDE